jgi:hypothetical protein
MYGLMSFRVGLLASKILLKRRDIRSLCVSYIAASEARTGIGIMLAQTECSRSAPNAMEASLPSVRVRERKNVRVPECICRKS